LQAKRQPLILSIDVEHHRLDDVALLEHFRRMLDALAPRHVGDVNEAVDLLFHFDERAEFRQVSDLALNLVADRILVRVVVPRIALALLETERNPPRGRIAADPQRAAGVAALPTR